MNKHVERADVLMEQGNYPKAEAEYRLALEEAPDDPHTLAMLAIALSSQDKFDEAERVAKSAVASAPDWSFTHYALAVVLHEKGALKEAQEHITEAISSDPDMALYRFVLASIHYREKRFEAALQEAETGLGLDAEHSGCNNIRSQALLKLGRKEEAALSVDTTLSQNPEDSATHGVAGWNYLERGERDKALEHFRESLRLDPNNEGSRNGLIQVLKMKNPVFRLLMNYFFWMSRLSSKAQWGVILGAYFGYRIILSISRTNPEWMPVAVGVGVVYGFFVFMTWAGDSLFNVLLFLHPQGRYALTMREKGYAAGIALCVVAALTLGVLVLTIKSSGTLFMGALALLLFTIPLGTASALDYPRNRSIMKGINGVLGIGIIAGIGATAFGFAEGTVILTVCMVAIVLFSWGNGAILKPEK